MKVYTRITKRILEGEKAGYITTDVFEVADEAEAKLVISFAPKGAKGGGIFGPRYEILAHDFVIE